MLRQLPEGSGLNLLHHPKRGRVLVALDGERTGRSHIMSCSEAFWALTVLGWVKELPKYESQSPTFDTDKRDAVLAGIREQLRRPKGHRAGLPEVA